MDKSFWSALFSHGFPQGVALAVLGAFFMAAPDIATWIGIQLHGFVGFAFFILGTWMFVHSFAMLMFGPVISHVAGYLGTKKDENKDGHSQQSDADAHAEKHQGQEDRPQD